MTHDLLHRRVFVKSLSGVLLAALPVHALDSVLDKPREKALYDEFSDEEKSLIKSSKLAQEIVGVREEGNNCAESVLTAVVRVLDRPEEIAHVAAPFGGGIGRFDLCGLLTGGHMALGLAAGMVHSDSAKFKSLARELSAKYWKWWTAWAPIHCHELRPNYDSEGFERMLQRVAAKIEQLIEPALTL